MNRRQNVCCSSKQVTLNGMQCKDARYILNMFSKYSRYLTYRYLTERYKEQVYVHYYVQFFLLHATTYWPDTGYKHNSTICCMVTPRNTIRY